MANELPEFISVPEVAQWLSVDPESVRRWLRGGQLPGVNLGGKAGWRIKRVDLDRFIEERYTGVSPPKTAPEESPR